MIITSSVVEGPYRPLSGPSDLVSMVVSTAARYPQRPALRSGERVLDYQTLLRQAFGLGAQLAELGVTPGSRVGLLTHPTLEAGVAMLAVLSCGAAYIPLNPDFPDQRLQAIAADGGAVCLLAAPEEARRAEPWAVPLHKLEGQPVERDQPVHLPGASDLAYVMYTSGSTGAPKGVPIRHQGVVNLLESLAESLNIRHDDRWLSVTALTFDISVLEHFQPWYAGAEVVVLPRAVVRDGTRLARAIEEFQPTLMQATPAGWRLLLESGWPGRREMLIMTGGEALTPRMASELVPRCRALWNLYGPTETTIWSSAHHVKSGDSKISLGKPVANTTLYVLKEDTLEPVELGQDGELCISGLALSPGYLGREQLTAEKFLKNPVSGTRDERIYRTGDRVRMLEDKSIEYLGRIDFQVKLRGFRIELGEIESVLGSHPKVRQGVVVLREDLPSPTLVAYLSGDRTPTDELRRFLAAKLPEYMVPGLFEWVETFALNSNGKIDRKALPAPTTTAEVADEGPVSPEVEAARHILGTRRVGMDEDLFEWGLDSLSAAHLARALQEIKGTTLTLDQIFAGRSLRKICASLEIPSQASLITDLEPGSATNLDPIVLVHTFTGSLPRDLARAVGGGARPVWGVRSLLDSEWTSSTPLTALEQLATRAVEDLRHKQPTGPLHLMGFSFGGILALEIARQWQHLGLPLGFLVILDTDIQHLVPGPARRAARIALGLVARVAALCQGLLPVSLGHSNFYRRLLRYGRRSQGRLSDGDIDDMLSAIPGYRDLPEVNRSLARRHFRMEEVYRPQPYSGPVLLIRRIHDNWMEEPALGWQRVASHLIVEHLQTVEHEVLNERNYPVIAQLTQRQISHPNQAR